ncbi:uncharacterized protein LOC111051686 isoform X1 [Nilaparvata lugens]|uniref:uncharacterized protein LOC111051686 isoform X1 n=1 Tax=Nilaparvata lugens TaxID=108931 RepID=UPI00193E9E53|nr:uncharacterized protein LOC111051686 isoform X1 [Nilaparvata lugens]XP_039284563.1 uncharacterized protein LOC111051686 isoform X1 [Nilaparvata lugens]XP_039284564.1 uncharacterized protein LOC111051686 isoform X1 [Nilaparvata lugens]XP_039284565.1 uncharacterized protein LOC111051686 isoform X1 [Nilaparvata lugens]
MGRARRNSRSKRARSLRVFYACKKAVENLNDDCMNRILEESRRELDILKEAEQSPSQDRPNYREEESSTSSDEETFFTNILKKIVKHGKHKMYLSDSKESNLSNEMESDNDDDNDDSAKPPKLSPLLKTHCTPTQYCPQHFPSPLPSSRLPSLRKTRNQQLRKPKNPQNH